jgi:large subunit ribosomal protein L21
MFCYPKSITTVHLRIWTYTMASRSAETMLQSGESFLPRRSSLASLTIHAASSIFRGTLSGSSRISARPTARLVSTTSTSGLPPLLPASTPSLPALPSTTSEAVSLIQSSSTPQLGRYVLARLHSRNYLLHPRDILTVPHLKGSPPPGTVLSLTRILQVGSRDFVIKAPEPNKTSPFGTQGDREVIPQQVAQCHLTVMEHTKSPMERKLLKKRRKGYKKTIEHKQGWTRLRVGDVFVGGETR